MRSISRNSRWMRAALIGALLAAIGLGCFGCGSKEETKDQGNYYTGPMKSKAEVTKPPSTDTNTNTTR